VPPTDNDCAISAPRIFDGERFLDAHCVLVRDGLVTDVVPIAGRPGDLEHIALEDGTLAPGLVDLQVNGGGDALFNGSPDIDTLRTIARAHRARGTTALLPTLVSDTRQVQEAGLDAVAAARAAGEQGVLGIHFEGPWFAPARRGAHSAGKLRGMAAEDVDWLCSLTDFPVLLTLAPETVASEDIARLATAGLYVCAGHTEATFEDIAGAASAGLCGVTHLYNAMSQLAGREPGTVGAALALDDLWAGIIADGHHVHPGALRLAHAAKPAGTLLLVSDAMATVGGTRGSFTLYDEVIEERGGRLVNAAGVLAGSAIALLDAVRYAHREAGLPLKDCLRMASRYPAAAIGLGDTLGRLAPGYRADMLHFSAEFSVYNTWVAGRRESA